MYKKVILKAFCKAQEAIPGRTSKTHVSEYLSSLLLNDFKLQISSRTLRNLYDDANEKKADEDISINSEYVTVLCNYLGFENYQAFIKETSSPVKRKNKIVSFIVKHWIILFICLLTITITIILTFNQQRWMIWDNTHYVEVTFDAKKYALSQLKIYNEDRVVNFKKIFPDCNTLFFTNDGTVKIWYGKNNSGDLEYFNGLAKHPETGKALKPLTKYMIKKYICED